MTTDEFLISLISSFGGSTQGRTLLQKRAYFVALLSGIDPNLKYDAHYYGPYSTTVDNAVGQLASIGFLSEQATNFGPGQSGFEIKRYDYTLTDDGRTISQVLSKTAEHKKIATAVKKIVDAGNPDYFILSIAAKALYILRKRSAATSKEEIIRQAQRFDWNIEKRDLDRAVQFLERLGIIRVKGD